MHEATASESLDSSAATIAHEELRITFEYQVQRLEEIDGKAIEIFKANLLLIGIVVTGFSILVQTDVSIEPFINLFTMAGALLLLISTGLAAVTYTASNLRGGMDTAAIDSAISGAARQGTNRFQVDLLRSYGRWIEYNARVTAVNDMLATVTILTVFVAFLYLIAGLAIGATDTTRLLFFGAFVALSAIVFSFAWIAYHMDNLSESNVEPDTFPGIRISKGRTRKDGFRDLIAMMRGRLPAVERVT